MFLNSTSCQNVYDMLFFWQCTALNSISGVTFSSCCDARPPLLSERQQKNVRTCFCLYPETKQKETRGSPHVSSKQHHEALCQLHTYCNKDTLWNISICSWIRWLYILYSCALLWHRLQREHHSWERDPHHSFMPKWNRWVCDCRSLRKPITARETR